MVPPTRRVLLAGASGTIGRATLRALVQQGTTVVCVGRPGGVVADAAFRAVDLQDAHAIQRDGICGERFDAVISCLASRSGAPDDAWAIDHRAHLALLAAAQGAAIPHFVLLSAICVQRPQLSGQVARVRAGKPFVVFGDGALTACTPISDADLATYLITCVDDPRRWDRILPVGGPGPALTPRHQGDLLFALAGRPARFTHVPVALMDAIVAGLSALARVIPPLRAKAEFARIGRYYATESMLVWDAARGRYDAAATPSFGTMTLKEHYAQLLRGETTDDRGTHAVF